MTSSQLYKLIEDVKRTGQNRTLEKDETGCFYKQIEKEMSPVVEKVRGQERLALEEAKTITIA